MGTDVKIGVVRDNLRTSTEGTGTQDLTVAGLGNNVKAAMFWANRAGDGEDGTNVDNARQSVGMAVSSTNRVVEGGRIDHGGATDQDGHMGRNDLCSGNIASNNTFNPHADFDSFITDGCRIDVTQTISKAQFVHALMFAGADVQADLKVVTASLSLNGTADVAISFEPNLIIMLTAGDQFDGNTHPGMAPHAMCLCTNDKAGTVAHASRSVAFRKANGVNTENGAYVSNTNFGFVDIARNQAGHDWEFELSFPDSTTARITTRKVGADPAAPEIAILLIDTSDLDVAVGIADTPTSSGSQSLGNAAFDPDIPFTPQAMMFLTSQVTALDTFQSGSEAGTAGFALGTESDQYAVSVSSEDNVGTTNTQSVSDDQFIHVPPEDGGATDDVKGAFTSFDDGGVTIEFSAVAASALKWPFLAIEAVAAPPAGGGFPFQYYYQQQGAA